MAKAYIKLGDKPKAWKSLQDAIKCNYDRWQVWDNLMVVSIDLGHFSEVRTRNIEKRLTYHFYISLYQFFIHTGDSMLPSDFRS